MSPLRNTPDEVRSAPSSRRSSNSATPPGEQSEQASPATGALTRVTANFTPRAIHALEKIAGETGDSKTDILNRSVLLYDAILEAIERDGGSLHLTYPDGTRERLRFIG
ncbi:hypothetical protein O7623_19985 [Solwaraspora sp. WMMD791]|uniref:hypothetical protein n=1 Tax=Solwaraspora sp. WMMD791 TaxID=3016086 RepID=UPI002499DE41|nr:hypothetical protein [Solwaraspora sp. WMMD791]WFE25649.1 hypothetical protein O7623_19985 [Solwaraspora sp. WMMD791]